MLFWTIFKSSINSLMANKMRSLLAMLGIIIGVGAVIAMLAMGAGAQAQIIDNIQKMGTNLLVVRPAQRGSGGVMSGTQQNLTVDDAIALRSLPGVDAVSPSVNGNVQAKYMNKNAQTSVTGGSVTYFQIRNYVVEQGRQFTEGEAEGLARVAVIGPVTAANLFGNDSPLGEQVKIKGINFTIIGVLQSKGDSGWNNPDDQLIVPYTTAMKILFGQDYLREIDLVCAEGVDLNEVSGEPTSMDPWHRDGFVHETPPALTSIAGLLRKRHHITDLSVPDDFRVQNQAEVIATLSQSVGTFRILLGSIASISLLVGGIGIMNIMLVTVTERTREIGTRKAIGAKSKDILMQFLVEAVIMSAVGGSMGAGAGIGLAKLIPMIPIFSTFTTIVQPLVVALAISTAAFVGIFFGLYPAYRASKLDPIEALRYE
jgi:putative ABC transport system permease protein